MDLRNFKEKTYNKDILLLVEYQVDAFDDSIHIRFPFRRILLQDFIDDFHFLKVLFGPLLNMVLDQILVYFSQGYLRISAVFNQQISSVHFGFHK